MLDYKDTISGKGNKTLSYAASLDIKKYRKKEEAFLIDGKKLLLEALKSPLSVLGIFVMESKKEELSPFLSDAIKTVSYSPDIYPVADALFMRLTNEDSPEGIIAAVSYKNKEKREEPKGRALILSGVRDPGNLGTVIRTALALGVEELYLSPDCADIYNRKVLRAAMGAVFKLYIEYAEEAEIIKKLRESGRRVFSAELREGAVPLYSSGLKKEDVIIIGNEANGIKEEVSSLSNGSIYIPISEKSESLNAAIAASLFIFYQSML